MRSWLVGAATLSHLPAAQTIDHEAFAVAAILHDLGWSHNASLVSPDKRFEVDGANAARKFLLQQNATGEWNEERIQLVWDAIALHTTPDIALHSRPLVGFLSAGVMTELFSPNVTLKTLRPKHVAATIEEWDAISSAFPRKELKVHLRETMVRLCRTKPEVSGIMCKVHIKHTLI